MSLNAIKNILDAERSTQEAYLNATAAARQMIDHAEAAGKALLAHTQEKALQEAKRLLAEAEAQGEASSAEILLHAENQCAVLRAHGDRKLPEAVNLIVERIVTG